MSLFLPMRWSSCNHHHVLQVQSTISTLELCKAPGVRGTAERLREQDLPLLQPNPVVWRTE